MEISVRLANPPIELVAKYTKKEREFFSDYANFVLELVSKSEIQLLLRGLIEQEQIQSDNLIDLRVMIFPARPLTGRAPTRSLHGSYNHDASQISIYPEKFPGTWIRSGGFELFTIPAGELSSEARRVVREIQLSSLSTLVHEVLHIKFSSSQLSRYSEEAIVRRLEKEHVQDWVQKLESLLVS